MNTAQMSEEIITTRRGKVVYTAKACTTGGRDGGTSRTSDGRLDVKFSFPGPPSNGTSPEQLLAVGWSGCFTSAVKIVAAKMKLGLAADLGVNSEVDLCIGDNGYFLQARLDVMLPDLERELARAVVDATHQTCPYSKPTHGNTDVAIDLEIQLR